MVRFCWRLLRSFVMGRPSFRSASRKKVTWISTCSAGWRCSVAITFSSSIVGRCLVWALTAPVASSESPLESAGMFRRKGRCSSRLAPDAVIGSQLAPAGVMLRRLRLLLLLMLQPLRLLRLSVVIYSQLAPALAMLPWLRLLRLKRFRLRLLKFTLRFQLRLLRLRNSLRFPKPLQKILS